MLTTYISENAKRVSVFLLCRQIQTDMNLFPNFLYFRITNDVVANGALSQSYTSCSLDSFCSLGARTRTTPKPLPYRGECDNRISQMRLAHIARWRRRRKTSKRDCAKAVFLYSPASPRPRVVRCLPMLNSS